LSNGLSGKEKLCLTFDFIVDGKLNVLEGVDVFDLDLCAEFFLADWAD
jgi:hypothetical protein